MPRVTYIEHDGTAHRLTVRTGSTVMAGAVREGVPGIDAECGGVCVCATCCVTVLDEWAKIVPPPDGMEKALLEGSPNFAPRLRLACQIVVTAALDGLVVHLPRSQRD